MPAAMSSQAADPRYRTLPPDALPRAESLADVSARLLPYWYDAIVPDLRAGGCVLVVSHGNTLRALVKHLESIPDDQIAGLEIPTGIPLVYQLSLICARMRWAASTSIRTPPAAASRPSPYRPRADPEEVHHEEQARR